MDLVQKIVDILKDGPVKAHGHTLQLEFTLDPERGMLEVTTIVRDAESNKGAFQKTSLTTESISELDPGSIANFLGISIHKAIKTLHTNQH